MNPAIWWGIIAAILIGAELLTGTFYILMIALGAAAGALAALLQLSLNWQIGIAVLVALIVTVLWHFKRYKNPKSIVYTENKDAIIDIGETVDVAHWGADQATQVHYRGAEWAARWVGAGEPQTGRCTIRGMKGSQLQLDKA